MTVLTKPVEAIVEMNITDNDPEMAALEAAANAMSETDFVDARKRIDWSKRTAQDFLRAMQLAFASGAHIAARNLAAEGAAQFPDNAELQKAAYILAPPKVTVSNGKLATTWKNDREWLKVHWDEYRGKWVALLDGHLLASADSADALFTQVGNTKNTDILVTPIW